MVYVMVVVRRQMRLYIRDSEGGSDGYKREQLTRVNVGEGGRSVKINSEEVLAKFRMHGV